MGKQKKQDKATDVIGITSNKTHAAESIQKNRKKINKTQRQNVTESKADTISNKRIGIDFKT